MAANHSVKWTAANRRGIFMHFVAAATYLKRQATMARFRVLLEGSGIDIPVGQERAIGFFVTRFVRAASIAAAGPVAAKVVATEWSSGRLQHLNSAPSLTVSEVTRVGFLTGAFARQPGYVFHPACSRVGG